MVGAFEFLASHDRGLVGECSPTADLRAALFRNLVRQALSRRLKLEEDTPLPADFAVLSIKHVRCWRGLTEPGRFG
jgi:hypothetical protein